MPIAQQVEIMEETFNVRSLYNQWWAQNKEQSNNTSFTITEVTYGLAMMLQFC
jgi:hypothetical protein